MLIELPRAKMQKGNVSQKCAMTKGMRAGDSVFGEFAGNLRGKMRLWQKGVNAAEIRTISKSDGRGPNDAKTIVPG